MEDVDLFKFVVCYGENGMRQTVDVTAEDEDHAIEKFNRWYPGIVAIEVEFCGQVY